MKLTARYSGVWCRAVPCSRVLLVTTPRNPSTTYPFRRRSVPFLEPHVPFSQCAARRLRALHFSERETRGYLSGDDELNINPPTPCLGKRPFCVTKTSGLENIAMMGASCAVGPFSAVPASRDAALTAPKSHGCLL